METTQGGIFTNIKTSITQSFEVAYQMIINFFSDKNNIIIILLFFIILSIIGINILAILGFLVRKIPENIYRYFADFFIRLGHDAGVAINKSGDELSDAAKVGIDMADGTIHSIGSLLDARSNADKITSAPSGDGVTPAVTTIAAPATSAAPTTPSNTSPISLSPAPTNDAATDSIQNPISATKSSWCLVGQYGSNRGCIEVKDQNKCMSGQIFPSQKMCLNPTFTQT